MTKELDLQKALYNDPAWFNASSRWILQSNHEHVLIEAWIVQEIRAWVRKTPGRQKVLVRKVWSLWEDGNRKADVDLIVSHKHGYDHFSVAVREEGPIAV